MKHDIELQNLIYNIAWLRREHRISKKEMALLLGVGMVNMNKIEKGEVPRRLGASSVIALCQRFGVLSSDLFAKKFGEL